LKLLEKNASFTDNVFHFISLEKLENDSAAKTIKISSKHFCFRHLPSFFYQKSFKKSHFKRFLVRLESGNVFNGFPLVLVTHELVVANLEAKIGPPGGQGSEVGGVAFQLRERSVTDQLDELGSTPVHLVTRSRNFSSSLMLRKISWACTIKLFTVVIYGFL
jgi:hypothetical protein